jgi:hypothetical protein
VLAKDLESLVWMTAAAVTSLQPRLLVTHACEGENLDHDATSFAVHMTARLLTRCGVAPPLVIELPRRRKYDGVSEEAILLHAQDAVRVDFGPASRKVKRRMLQCHGEGRGFDHGKLQSECYLLAKSGNPAELLENTDRPYLDASWCRVSDFRKQARDVAAMFNRAVPASHLRA